MMTPKLAAVAGLVFYPEAENTDIQRNRGGIMFTCACASLTLRIYFIISETSETHPVSCKKCTEEINEASMMNSLLFNFS